MTAARRSPGVREYGGAELEAQRAARARFSGIPPFPDLERMLIAEFGPTAEAIMLHQLVYWFTRQGMRDRWSVYLTYEDWREQRGLNRKQVDRGRARLRPTGIVEETYGNYKRLHYTPDWVQLARRLQTPLKGVQSPSDTPEGGTVETETAKGGTVRTVPPSEPYQKLANPHKNGARDRLEGGGKGVQSNAVEYARDHAPDYGAEHVPEGTPPPTSAGNLVAVFFDHLGSVRSRRGTPEDACVPIPKAGPHSRKSFAGDVARAVERGREPALIEKAVRRRALRWDAYRIDLDSAIGDVLGGAAWTIEQERTRGSPQRNGGPAPAQEEGTAGADALGRTVPQKEAAAARRKEGYEWLFPETG